MKQHPKTWWFKLTETLFPGRCREVPEATEPDRILIRQFAIVKKHVYLQQFASGENPHWYHSHPWSRGTVAIGLWGSLIDRRYGMTVAKTIHRRAPYLNIMHAGTIHQSNSPSPGHTSIFIGLGEKTDQKGYYEHRSADRHWSVHIKKKVRRI